MFLTTLLEVNMTYYIKNGNLYKPTAEAALDIHTTLPVGNYIIKQDDFGNMFFELVDDFTTPSKLYGDTVRHTDRIISTFLDREASTGVMLAGEKGSGKSLLGKNISIEAAKLGIPTVIINAPWCGDKFNKFIQDIKQPCVIMLDEFEKVYDREGQEKILTLLDGVFPTKKLFVLTCNDKWRVDIHMRNRPGRIFYMLDFDGLNIEFVREYCQDKLENTQHVEDVCKIVQLFNKFNFDMLKALVEEMNRYGETPQQAMSMLNTKPEFEEGRQTYKFQLVLNGQEVPATDLYTDTWTGNPLNPDTKIKIEYREYEDNDTSKDWDWEAVVFNGDSLKKVSDHGTKYFFAKDQKTYVTLIKEQAKNFDYYSVL